MGLSLSSIPNPQQRIDTLERELYQANRDLADLREELRLEKIKTNGIEQGVHELRYILNPLYKALKLTFGEMDAMGMTDAGPTSAPKNTAVWESWKQKLGGHTAKAIDVLLLHGSMNRTQLRIHLGCAAGTVTNVVAALNKAGIINKSGTDISLKEL